MDLTIYTHTVSTASGKLVETMTDTPAFTGWWADNGGQLVATERTTFHLEVGTPVLVHAFGRLRPGVVTKLGRTKVTVDYQRNQAGTRASRSFTVRELAPTRGTTFTREDVAL